MGGSYYFLLYGMFLLNVWCRGIWKGKDFNKWYVERLGEFVIGLCKVKMSIICFLEKEEGL